MNGDYSRYDGYKAYFDGTTNMYKPQQNQDVGNSGANAGIGMGFYDQLKAISDNNNQFNLEQVAAVNAFNAKEAQKNRDWQERMSNTAHQREVADLMAAGLNPILSAMGQGAYTGSGASASGQKAVADNVLGNGLISLMSSMIQASSAESVAKIYAAASMYGADKKSGDQINYTDMWKTITAMNNATSSANSDKNVTTNLINTFLHMIPAAMYANQSRRFKMKYTQP